MSIDRRGFLTFSAVGAAMAAEPFAAERAINGLSAEQRMALRKTRIAPLVAELEGWMRDERARISRLTGFLRRRSIAR